MFALIVAAVVPAAASAQVQPYGTNDHGGFRNILLPGTNGFVDLQQLIQSRGGGCGPGSMAVVESRGRGRRTPGNTAPGRWRDWSFRPAQGFRDRDLAFPA